MYQEVLTFWFKEISPPQWWNKNPEFDQLVIKRFSALHQQAIRAELYTWRETAQGRLAEIIILDQFSRNMFRGTAQSFQYDALALALSQEAINAEADKQLSPIENSFLYMPFMHSESLMIHEVATILYKKNGIQSNLDFELKHKAIIERFGRYPHRNKLLNRKSTDEEIEFLKSPGSSF